MKDRGRQLENILNQYVNFVKPAFEEFCLPVSTGFIYELAIVYLYVSHGLCITIMNNLCASHVLFICITCFVSVHHMFYLCASHVLFLCITCFIMFDFCASHVLFMCITWFIYVHHMVSWRIFCTSVILVMSDVT